MLKCYKWQSQFLLSGSHGDGQWIVPITLCCGSYDNAQNVLLEKKSGALDMNEFCLVETATGGKDDGNSQISSWIKLNINQTGFYRVKYDEDLAARLGYAIENKYLSATDRFGSFDVSTHSCLCCWL